MEIIKTDIEGVFILEPKIFYDPRGYFFESYNKTLFEQLIGPVNFVQDNESCSSRGVLRGLHFQRPPHTQAKLVRCVRGAVLDVAMDIRSDTAVFQYKCDNYYCPEADGGISILDPSLGIEWQIDLNEAILSEKDKKHPLLKDFDSPFSI